jgi:hypothetical protein
MKELEAIVLVVSEKNSKCVESLVERKRRKVDRM